MDCSHDLGQNQLQNGIHMQEDVALYGQQFLTYWQAPDRLIFSSMVS